MEPMHSEEILPRHVFARLDSTALGIAIGSVAGVVLFLATQILLLRGGSPAEPYLALLGEYFAGYSVSFAGSLIGLMYGFFTGFVGGWLLAFLHNLAIATYVYLLQFKANLSSITKYLDADHSQP